MRKRRPFRFTVSFCLLAGLVVVGPIPLVSCGSASRSLNFTTIDFSGSHETIVFRVNSSGEVVGSYFDSSNAEHGFLWQAGSFTTFDVPGGVGATQAQGINDLAETTGEYGNNQVVLGFLRQPDGSTVNIDPPASAGYTEADGVNNAGAIVGRYFGNSPGFQGFVFSNGSYTTINAPGATNTSLFGINNLGDIVDIDASGATHGLLMSNGNITTIDFPGSTNTNAQDINDNGEIVGSTVVNDVRHGYLFSNGKFTMIDNPGASLAPSGLPLSGTDVHGINASGEVAGTYQDSGGVIHGFVAK